MDSTDEWMKVKDDALRLLSFSPRSISELRSRLKMKKHPEEWIEKAVALLVKDGLLDDEKFARLYALSRSQSRPTGKNRIRQELTLKGLSSGAIESAMTSIHEVDEKESALEVAAKRMRLMKGLPVLKQKMRILGFLKRRGFSSEAVYHTMNKIFKNLEDFQ